MAVKQLQGGCPCSLFATVVETIQKYYEVIDNAGPTVYVQIFEACNFCELIFEDCLPFRNICGFYFQGSSAMVSQIM